MWSNISFCLTAVFSCLLYIYQLTTTPNTNPAIIPIYVAAILDKSPPSLQYNTSIHPRFKNNSNTILHGFDTIAFYYFLSKNQYKQIRNKF